MSDTRDMRATNTNPLLNQVFREEAGIHEPAPRPRIWIVLSKDNGKSLRVESLPFSPEGMLAASSLVEIHLSYGAGSGVMLFVDVDPPDAVTVAQKALADGL